MTQGHICCECEWWKFLPGRDFDYCIHRHKNVDEADEACDGFSQKK